MSAPARYSNVTAPMVTPRTCGRSAGVRAISDASVGIMPPIAKPIFHESPVPEARMLVGNRSFRKIRIGANPAHPSMLSEAV